MADFDPRDTNKDGKVGPLEAAAARGNIFAKGLNKAVDFATVDDPNSQQVKNAAAAIGGAGESGGTVDTRAQMLKGTEAGNNLIQAKSNELANKDPSKAEELAEATKQASAEAEKAGSEELGEGDTSSGKVPVSSETVEEAKKDPQSRYKLKSIFQAYADGDIDKGTRNYLVADTLGAFARNMGKDIGNVAAAYGGGSMNNERESDMWTKRNQEMAASAMESEKASVDNSRENRDAEMAALQRKAQQISNWNASDSRRLANLVESKLYDANGNLKIDPASPRGKELLRQIQALRGGGMVNESLVKELLSGIVTGSLF